MLQFSKVLASLCAGCLCTLTIHQIPALGNVLLPQTHAIPETSPCLLYTSDAADEL